MAGELKAEPQVGGMQEKPGGQQKDFIFLRLARLLEAKNIAYCLVGDTRHFPKEIRSDLDFVVLPEALGRIPQVLADFCAEQQVPIFTDINEYAADFWPEDESADDINAFVAEQRRIDREASAL